MAEGAASGSHYDTLGVSALATAAEIKRAYRHLVKHHHPDSLLAKKDRATSERIRQINAAYTVLKDPQSRRDYDRQLYNHRAASRPQPTGSPGETVSQEATAREAWIRQVYTPLNRILGPLLSSLKPQLNALAADPFDPDLLDSFVGYLEECRQKLAQAQQIFRRIPNPSSLGGVASRLYYSLNHLEDALEELNYFPLNFDDRHLHTGQELFRRAKGLRTEAMDAYASRSH
ncbi:J domain-containing protein [Thermostichus vulcanus]|uniref:DnaJ domain-containing protein n=1 Tax=Thermostichus vulcanus str. 'Rupite' TaxID=2813851 RepID=A0ABT0CF49_THEVL|nr:J domain-containing protein [Thermostichus vulcanus]MCJ2544414.1 DnaJ domain-containing protein [Thermostichus vulcanus str. 'Rupite']